MAKKDEGKSVLQQAAELERKLMKLRGKQQERLSALELKFKAETDALLDGYDDDVIEKAGVAS